MKAQAFPWLLLSSLFTRPRAPRFAFSAHSALSSTDKAFMEKAARAGHAEVAAGKLASGKAMNDQVKKFGERMVQDHGKAGDELKKIAQGKDIKLPEEPDSAHKKLVAKLESSKGADFDRLYVAEAGSRTTRKRLSCSPTKRRTARTPTSKLLRKRPYPPSRSTTRWRRT